MNIENTYNNIETEIISIRRKIHENPELSNEEFKTAKTICEFLDKYKISYKSGIFQTGICAIIGNPDIGKCVLIRADMDALPFEEKTNLSFASKIPGVMHACGHDLHASAALATAYILKQYESELNGCVKIVFQPAEETSGGAEPMINNGVLDNPNVDICLGAHVSPSYATGELYFKSGPLMAAPDDFIIEIIGKSSHGAEPEKGINPIIPASKFVTIIHDRLSQHIDFNNNVFTVCCLESGTTFNIIPDNAVIKGTFRSFSNDDRSTADRIINDVLKELSVEYGVKYNYTYGYRYPPLINDVNLTEEVKSFAAKLYGSDKIKNFTKPLMTGEDFSYFAQSRPSVFVWAGCGVEGKDCVLHSSTFEADEKVIGIVAKLFSEYTLYYLNT